MVVVRRNLHGITDTSTKIITTRLRCGALQDKNAAHHLKLASKPFSPPEQQTQAGIVQFPESFSECLGVLGNQGTVRWKAFVMYNAMPTPDFSRMEPWIWSRRIRLPP